MVAPPPPHLHDLLILTDGRRRGRNALTLPFRNATVVEAVEPDLPAVSGEFDAIVVDRDQIDIDWLQMITGRLRPVLRPAGLVVVLAGDGAAAQLARDQARRTLARHLESRWHSERALLDRLDVLTATLARERRRRHDPDPGRRLRQSLARRAPRWLVRLARPLAGRLRRRPGAARRAL